eukprot:scaffold4099_cov73-Skeletonema_dohrnii-CCMP3373.AAC.5
MADAAAAAAPPGGNDANGNANHQQPPAQPTSPRRALKITILAKFKDVASYRIRLSLEVFDDAVVMDQALMMARVCRDRERIDIW